MHTTLLEGFKIASTFEKYALIGVVVIAILGLVYAAFLTRQILREPEGNEKMRHIASAIRSGGNAYLMRQFRTILLLVFLLAVCTWSIRHSFPMVLLRRKRQGI